MSGRRRVTVLYIIGSLGPGGAERQLVQILLRLDRQRFRPVVACLTTAGDEAAPVRDRGIEVVELGMRPRRPWPLSRLTRLARRLEGPILHTFLFQADVYGLLAALPGGPARIVTTRRCLNEAYPFRLRAYRLTNPLVDRVVAVSGAVYRESLELEGLPAGKLVEIPNGVDTVRFAPGDREEARARLGLSAGERVVGTVGTIKEIKGSFDLLRGARLLAERGHRPRFLYIGHFRPRDRERLERLAAEEGVVDQLLVTGPRDDIPELLPGIDVYVQPSRAEGMSNSLLEAMAAARPIVATAVGGNGENLDDGRCGWLVPPRSPGELADALAGLLDDAEESRRLGRLARERVQKHYSAAGSVRRLETLYDEIL